ncbi:MAG: sterol desaturase family protein [Microthrixaceae bacterium]
MNIPIVILAACAAFCIMEPVTALTHRLVFHGFGHFLHRSHHRPGSTGWEANDFFPVIFAGITISIMALGALRSELSILIAIGAGVTAYGISYLVIHDFYIHRRVALFPKKVALLEPLREAHRIHHLYNDAPYGMLVPVIPAKLRERAATTSRDPIAVPVAAELAS